VIEKLDFDNTISKLEPSAMQAYLAERFPGT